MRRFSVFALALTSVVALSVASTGCDKKSTETKATAGEKEGATEQKAGAAEKTAPKPAPKIELVDIDITEALTKAGRTATSKVTVKAPKGAKVSESFGDVEVVAGKDFALAIGAEGIDLAQEKKEFKNNDVQKLQGFTVDKPDGIIVKTKFGRRVSHFVTANKKVGEETFGCRSKRGATSFSEAQAQAMLAACHTITAAK